MADIWFLSDHHIFHENILKFKDEGGKLIRPSFQDVDEMNWTMVENHNKVVKTQDKVWFGGDFAFKTTDKADQIAHMLRSMNGHKRLILGNHDNIKAPCIYNSFEKIVLWKGFEDQFTLTHIPLRLDNLRDGKVNVHGHIHQNLMKEKGYINICVEHRNYTPVHYDAILAEVKAQL